MLRKITSTGLTIALLAALIMPVLLFASVSYAQQDVNPVVSTEDTQNGTDNDEAASSAESDALPSTVQIENGLCAGANLDVTSNCSTNDVGANATEKINALIADVINIFSLVVGVVSVIMIIIGGFRYITSGGDSSNVSSAKNTILYALIGLAVAVFSQAIVVFLLSRL